VGQNALPTYESGGLVSGPGGHGWYLLRLRRLNRSLDTGYWRVYKRKEESNWVHLVLSIDTPAVAVLQGMRWIAFRGVGQDISLLRVMTERKK
jgi:hypothetical protein